MVVKLCMLLLEDLLLLETAGFDDDELRSDCDRNVLERPLEVVEDMLLVEMDGDNEPGLCCYLR